MGSCASCLSAFSLVFLGGNESATRVGDTCTNTSVNEKKKRSDQNGVRIQLGVQSHTNTSLLSRLMLPGAYKGDGDDLIALQYGFLL